jgi:hypothetical protein
MVYDQPKGGWPKDYRCEDRKYVGELGDDIGVI